MSSTVTSATAGGGVQLTEAILEVYSKEISFVAEPSFRFAQFATVVNDLNATPGLKVTFMRYANLSDAEELTEGTPMETEAMSASQTHIEVTEYGKATSVTELALKASFTKIMKDAAILLGRNYARLVDTILRDALLTSANEICAGRLDDVDALQHTGASPKLFDSALLKDAVEVLETKNVRKYNGDAYICFCSPHQTRGLKDDPDYKLAKDYTSIYAGEIGRIDDIIFITSTMNKITTLADHNDVHTAIMVGENAYGWAKGQEVSMRDNGIEDFGRKHSLAWYAIMGADLVETNNVIKLQTN